MVDLKSPLLFTAAFYTRHNQRRLEHLSSLGLNLCNKTVLEPGAGIGHHSLFYIDRGCHVTAYEPRRENCDLYRQTLQNSWSPSTNNANLIEAPYQAIAESEQTFDIVHCYGFLYHVGEPDKAIEILACKTDELLILETCVSMDKGEAINTLFEPPENPAQAFDGQGCRPTRSWLMTQLKRHFQYVYATKTQPYHEEFPTDWTKPWPNNSGLTRAVFVASRASLESDQLTETLPEKQTHHKS